jgi:SAM-dependent methyltransferase
LLVRYYLWALSEKAASYVPFGRSIALATCDLASKDRGSGQSFVSTFPVVRKVHELTPPGGTVLDVGTGWFHHDPFLIYLTGDYTVYLCDIEDRGNLRAIRNYLHLLLSSQDLVCSELGISHETMEAKLAPLLHLETRADIYRKCHFVPAITAEPTKPFLPEESIDLMIGSCVLNHIPPPMLAAELRALRRMLKPTGYMYFLIGHDDHWAFHDPSANMFNYYRYSDAYYHRFFETKFEYHNRMVKEEWFDLFRSCQLSVKEYAAHVTDRSQSEIAHLPAIDPRFAKYPREDLAIQYSYFLLSK